MAFSVDFEASTVKKLREKNHRTRKFDVKHSTSDRLNLFQTSTGQQASWKFKYLILFVEKSLDDRSFIIPSYDVATEGT